jgi:ubiquinone biosynthesis protein UbiJ
MTLRGGQVRFASKVITFKIQSFTSVVIIVISHGKLETPTGGFSLGNSTSNLGVLVHLETQMVMMVITRMIPDQ